jgi:aldose 1-epimerase
MYRLSLEEESLVIDMNQGMTVVQYIHQGSEVLHYAKARYLAGKTYGVPILFPTPNRIADGAYQFLGECYEGLEHGLVRQEPFQYAGTYVTEEAISIVGSWELKTEHALFRFFPWKCKLVVEVILGRSSLVWKYSVMNLEDEKPLGFGFALHPFFLLDQQVTMQVSAPWFMESSDSGYPTGNILPVKDTPIDLRNPVPAISRTLDTVYYNPSGPVVGSIQYNSGSVLTLTGSSEFKHLVVYTPKDAGFFCLENQSCSADTHNLYAKGYTNTSALILLKAGERHTGQVTWSWNIFDTF